MAPIPSDDVKDFSARTFIAGGFHGRRTFRIIRASDGLHMHGPIFDGDWTPGAVTPAGSHRCHIGWSGGKRSAQ